MRSINIKLFATIVVVSLFFSSCATVAAVANCIVQGAKLICDINTVVETKQDKKEEKK